VVAYYRELPGESSQWRRRASFYAFKTVYARLVGARYRCRYRGEKGLEIHTFEKGDVRFHIVWTKNGALARCTDVYREEDLRALSGVATRDGLALEALPEYFTESPFYLTWEGISDVEPKAGADILAQVIAARTEPGSSYFSCHEGSWRGLVHARSRKEADTIIAALKPGSIAVPDESVTLRKARNAIWTVPDPLNPNRTLVVKKPLRVAWHKRILDCKKPSKALRSWNGTSELQRRGIETPKVVAYFEHEDGRRVLDNWFICEHAGTRLSVRGFFAAYARGEARVEGYSFEEFTEQLIASIRKMHWRGVYFRDLSGGNVLVRIRESRELSFSLIDTARARFANQRFSRSKRIADLKRLVHKLDPDRQEAFVQAYLNKEGARFNAWHRFTFRFYALKAALKRTKRMMRKRFPSK